MEERRLDADPEAMANRYIRGLGDFGELFPDALAVLDSVRDNARVGLVTNGIGEVQRARLERLNLAGRFEVVVISGEVGVAKPGTEIFDLAFAGMPGADRAHTLMIGDSLTSDIAGGVNAGIDTCWFDRGGAHPNPNSAEPSPTYRITHLSEIPAVVAG